MERTIYKFSISKSQKKIQSKILSKAEVAIEAINHYQMKNLHYIDLTKNQNYFNQSSSIFKMPISQYDYVKILRHKQLQINKTLKFQLFPFSEQYYQIDMKQISMPLRLLITNVRGSFRLYLGYDKQYPGVKRQTNKQMQQEQKNQNQNKSKSKSKNKIIIKRKSKSERKSLTKYENKKNKDKCQNQNETLIQEKQLQIQKTYDEKYFVNRQIMILLRGKKNQSFQKQPNQKQSRELNIPTISKLYISIVAQSQLTLFSLKVDSIGIKYQVDQFNLTRTKTEGAHQNRLPTLQKRRRIMSFNDPSHVQINKNVKQFLENLNGKLFKTVQQSSLQDSLAQRMSYFKKMPLQNQVQSKKQPRNEKKKKNDNNFQYQKLNSLTKNSQNNSELMKNRNENEIQKDQNLKLQQVQLKKQAVQLRRTKQRQLSKLSSQFKQMIADEEKRCRANKNKKNQLTRNLAIMLYFLRFLSNCSLELEKNENKNNKNIKINYLVKKLVNATKKTRKQLYQQIPSRNIRALMGIFNGANLIGKVQNTNAVICSQLLIIKLFNQFKSPLTLNGALNKATIYRRNLRLIQKCWLAKYSSRFSMLQMFSHDHVQEMITQFPHFKVILKEYKQSKIYKKICYEYITDESTKFRHIYQVYLHQIKQIEEYQKVNEQITVYNMNKKPNRMKPTPYFEINSKIIKPQHRFFRNLDILKSMLRGWFQLKYKQWIKKNIQI